MFVYYVVDGLGGGFVVYCEVEFFDGVVVG